MKALIITILLTAVMAVPVSADEAGEKALAKLGKKAARYPQLEVNGKLAFLVDTPNGDQRHDQGTLHLAYDRKTAEVTLSTMNHGRKQTVFSNKKHTGKWSDMGNSTLSVLPLTRKYHLPTSEGWAGGLTFSAPVVDALHGYAGTMKLFQVSQIEKKDVPKGSENLSWFKLELRDNIAPEHERWLKSWPEIKLGIEPSFGSVRRMMVMVPADEKRRQPKGRFELELTTSSRIRDKSVFAVPAKVLETLAKERAKAADAAKGKKTD